MSATADVWVDGQALGVIPADDRGLAYGDGLFETMAVVAGVPVLLSAHLARLAEGAQRLGLPVALAALSAQIGAFLAGRDSGVLKLILTRGSGGRGYLPPSPTQSRVVLSWHPPVSWPREHRTQGIVAGLCRQRLGLNPQLAGLKHLNRLEQVLLRQELATLGTPEALVLDLRERVVEGVFSNVFLVQDGVLLTPELSESGVAGVMRGHLIARAQALGLPVQVRPLWLADIHRAAELFFCNSVYGIWPVRAVAGRDLEAGPITGILARDIAVLFPTV